MLEGDTKRSVRGRLRRVAGQVKGIERMLDEDRDCADLVHQLAAAQAALGKVGKVVLTSHVAACLGDAIRSGGKRERKRKLAELMTVFSRYGQLREP